MFIVRKEPPTFPDVAAEVLRSVVAVAVGTTTGDRPNIVGTGFACEASEFYVRLKALSAHSQLAGSAS